MLHSCFPKPRRQASAFDQRAESRAEVLRATLSAFSSFPKNGGVVLVSVTDESVFRWVSWRKARGTILPCRPLVPYETHSVFERQPGV